MLKKQVFNFQTEVKQLLSLVINSLYSNREIFLRELISNASDAVEKLKFELLKNSKNIAKSGYEFSVKIYCNKEQKIVVVSDNGIGLSKKEAIDELGTIAKSGTKKIIDSLKKKETVDQNGLIGQFGVGFYSSFLISEKVVVESLKFGLKNNEAVRWSSSADGSFSIENISKKVHGTDVILYVKKDCEDLLSEWKLRQISKKYSNYLNLRLQMLKIETDEKGKETITEEWETINQSKALWTVSKSKITDFEYKEFYKTISHDYSDPFAFIHNKIEGKLEYHSLLYIPSRANHTLWDRDQKSGLNLYVQRVFIMENEHLLPQYLRFIKGIIDSNDLPLNISREILQHNHIIQKMKKSSTRKILDLLYKISLNDPERYYIFWKEFGQVLKEGISEDFDNKERISKILLFSSTYSNLEKENTSLDDYISRMRPEQKIIYYITAESFNSAKNNPQLEVFREKNIEVLLLYNRVDEWMMSHLSEYSGKNLKSILKGDLDLGELNSKEEKDKQEREKKKFQILVDHMKKILLNKVETVRLSKRLKHSPSCIVVNDYGVSMHLQKIMADSGQANFGSGLSAKPILEINSNHKIIQYLKEEGNISKVEEWTYLLYQQAMLIEGAKLEDPSRFVSLMNNYLSKYI